MISIRTAEADDAPAILSLSEAFIHESDWGLSFDRDHAWGRIWSHIHDDSTDYVTAWDGDLLAGVCHVGTDRDYTQETLGYVIKFYVMPEHRGTPVSRALMSAAMEWFEARDCRFVFATSTAGVGASGQLYKNMMGKFGFADCGPTLVADLRGT